ncbi:CYTH domain-containing protein [Microvirga sp. VF16]|uniref:CYTH domain-containing protein n=1 Tax=Microvirga sp. VF16 TaxID=2807101 RepID=UPI00193DB194|nr:CYTH domain-containing protein [Microvirga sp. VF16]
MPVEIERKFLVVSDGWRENAVGQRFCQGYLARADGVTVRVRRAGSWAYLTVKGEPNGFVRSEFEYEVPVEEAEAMFKLCHRPLIEKTRYEVPHAGLVWHVDEFAGDNAGLVLAEVGLDHPEQPIERPAWLGQEVSHDPRFRNSRLVDAPKGQAVYACHTVSAHQAATGSMRRSTTVSPDVEAITRTLEELSTRAIANGELLQEVQRRHPQASAGDIMHAAFLSVTDPARRNSRLTSRMYDFALAARRML